MALGRVEDEVHGPNSLTEAVDTVAEGRLQRLLTEVVEKSLRQRSFTKVMDQGR